MTLTMASTKTIAVKVCGITKIDQAKRIAQLGVNALGVIGVKSSPRYLEEKQRAELFNTLRIDFPLVERVLVVADINDLELEKAIKSQGAPSIIQLHGKESPKRCQELRKLYPMLKWWKALRIKSKEDLEIAQNFQGVVNALLLDAWSSKELGGTGERIPLEWIKEANLNSPWWLAGGISAEWVPTVMEKVKPFGLDASSRLEISPGVKDIEKVKRLIKCASNYC